MTFIENAVHCVCVNLPDYLGTKADVAWDKW
jgi:hypothetical protein